MVQTSPTPFEVGRAFVHQYYTLLHQAPELLHRFYSTDSTFIHGGVDRPGSVEQPAVGPDAIAQRIIELSLQDCHAKIRQVDSHPTIGNGVVVQVTGELSNNGSPMRRFMQTFVLAPRQPKKYYVQNDIFRYQDEVFDDVSDEDDRSSSQIYGDADKVSNADSSAPASQQPLLVSASTRAAVEDVQPQHQALPPRNQQQQQQQQQQVIPKQPEPPLNGLNEATGFNGQQESVQDTQQQNKQTSATTTTTTTEGTSYAGIAKLKSATGTVPNVPAPIPASIPPPPPPQQQQQQQQPAPSRPPTAGKTTAPNRANNPQQQQRGNGNYFSANNRGNQWSDNQQQPQQQDQFPGRRSGANLAGAPDEQHVFVGSLPLDFSREDLIDCFKQFGNILDAKIRTPTFDNKKNYGFVAFEDVNTATHVVSLAHVNYKGIRLNVEQKTRGGQNNANNGPPYSRNYPPRGGGGRGNRSGYRGAGNNPRRGGGGQYRNNSPSFTAGIDENYKVPQAQQQQQQE